MRCRWSRFVPPATCASMPPTVGSPACATSICSDALPASLSFSLRDREYKTTGCSFKKRLSSDLFGLLIYPTYQKLCPTETQKRLQFLLQYLQQSCACKRFAILVAGYHWAGFTVSQTHVLITLRPASKQALPPTGARRCWLLLLIGEDVCQLAPFFRLSVKALAQIRDYIILVGKPLTQLFILHA